MDQGERGRLVRKHIFAVNGEPDFLGLLRVLFQREEYNVTTTNFVPHTFEQIAALDPELLLVDLVRADPERYGGDALLAKPFDAMICSPPSAASSARPDATRLTSGSPPTPGGWATKERCPRRRSEDQRRSDVRRERSPASSVARSSPNTGAGSALYVYVCRGW